MVSFCVYLTTSRQSPSVFNRKYSSPGLSSQSSSALASKPSSPSSPCALTFTTKQNNVKERKLEAIIWFWLDSLVWYTTTRRISFRYVISWIFRGLSIARLPRLDGDHGARTIASTGSPNSTVEVESLENVRALYRRAKVGESNSGSPK